MAKFKIMPLLLGLVCCHKPQSFCFGYVVDFQQENTNEHVYKFQSEYITFEFGIK